jgi:hypothetical protein
MEVTYIFFYPCTVHFDIYKVHTPTNALFIKLDTVFKFTLKTTLACSYMFRSATIIREPSLEPGSNEGSLMMVVDRNMLGQAKVIFNVNFKTLSILIKSVFVGE